MLSFCSSPSSSTCVFQPQSQLQAMFEFKEIVLTVLPLVAVSTYFALSYYCIYMRTELHQRSKVAHTSDTQLNCTHNNHFAVKFMLFNLVLSRLVAAVYIFVALFGCFRLFIFSSSFCSMSLYCLLIVAAIIWSKLLLYFLDAWSSRCVYWMAESTAFHFLQTSNSSRKQWRWKRVG